MVTLTFADIQARTALDGCCPRDCTQQTTYGIRTRIGFKLCNKLQSGMGCKIRGVCKIFICYALLLCYIQYCYVLDYVIKHLTIPKIYLTLKLTLKFNCYGTWKKNIYYIDGSVQYGSNSSGLAMELLQSCTKPAICYSNVTQMHSTSMMLVIKKRWHEYFIIINCFSMISVYWHSVLYWY